MNTTTEMQTVPEAQKAIRIADSAYSIALAYEIDSPEVYQMAGDELREIATKRKDIEELRKSLTRPLDESKKRIMDLFRQPTERLAEAEKLLRSGMLTFQRAEAERQAEERRKAEEAAAAEYAEAERREREAQEAAHAAQESGDAEAAAKAAMEAEKAREELETADIAPIAVQTESPKASGISTRTTYKAEVTDFKALVLAAAKRAEAGDDFLLGFLQADTKAISGAARSMREKLAVPGIRVYEDQSLSVRRAG